jgi:hypothetical protein
MTPETLQKANAISAAIAKLNDKLQQAREIEKAMAAPDFHFKFYYKARTTYSNIGDFTPTKSRFLAYLKAEQADIEQGIEKLKEQLNNL